MALFPAKEGPAPYPGATRREGRQAVAGQLRDYARLWLVRHMLYPRCTAVPQYHAATLAEFCRREGVVTIDYCLPYQRKEEAS
jgi:hypothetical protein